MSGNFYIDIVRGDPRFTSTDRIAAPELLEPRFRMTVLAIIADAKAEGVDLMIWETYRSQQRQLELFAQGATKLKQVGVHHYGLACDLVRNVGGEPSWKGDFSILCRLAHAHGVVSGQDWGKPGVWHDFIDADHLQRIAVDDQPRLFGGEWYPDENYRANSE